MHRVCLEKAHSFCRSDDSLSGGSERDWATFSICIPKVMMVDGGDRFSTLVIIPRESQRA